MGDFNRQDGSSCSLKYKQYQEWDCAYKIVSYIFRDLSADKHSYKGDTGKALVSILPKLVKLYPSS